MEKKAKSKAGKDYKFYGCTKYPVCDFTTFYKPLPDKFCTECGYPLGENRLGRRLLGLKCTNKSCKTNAKEETPPLAEAA